MMYLLSFRGIPLAVALDWARARRRAIQHLRDNALDSSVWASEFTLRSIAPDGDVSEPINGFLVE